MKKGLLSIVSLISVTAGPLHATTSFFRTPLSFIESRWGTVHYPFAPESCGWNIDTMGVYYQRSACDAFGCDTSCCQNNCPSLCGNTSNDTSTTRKTVPLSQLWFGKSSFKASDMFAGSSTSTNPFLNFTTFAPQFNYYERGVALAVNAYRMVGCDKSWFVGVRAALPICTVEVNQTRSASIATVNPDFDNTIVTIQQQYNGNGSDPVGAPTGSADSRTVKAYRLDLLSSLQLPDGTPMVQYGTVTGDITGNTRIAGQDITTNRSQSMSGGNNRAPVYAYQQSSGVVPLPPQGLTKSDPSLAGGYLPPVGQNLMVGSPANAVLNADGSGLSDGQWGAFGGYTAIPTIQQQVNYAGGLGANTSAQKQLFIVPVAPSSAGATFEPIGLIVQNTIDYVIEQLGLLDVTALDFFAARGIDFAASDCTTGAGDTFVDIYGGRWCDCWFADALVGFRLPTGTDADNPKRIYEQTTGNNGHFGLKVGAEGGYRACDWLALKGDVFWRHNFRATEKRAAAFVGATVHNIGPCVDAQVKWNDLQVHVDATFFTPRCPNTGWDLGYEFYYRTKDDICYCAQQVYDLIGNVQKLDPNVGAADSRLLSHKVRGEIFNQWGCFEVFLGASYVFAGDNVMKEREWHIGMKAYF